MSPRPLSSEELQRELTVVRPRGHYAVQSPDLPLGFLSARQFELFAHALLNVAAPASGWYDRVQILPEGADAGADVHFLHGDHLVGVAQCKRYKSRITRPVVLAEIFKFLLFAQAADQLPRKGFRYQFWTSQDVARTTAGFFASPVETLMGLSDPEIALAVDHVRRDVSTLQLPQDERERDRLRQWAQRLSISHVGPARIAELAAGSPTVRGLFFRGPDDNAGKVDVSHVERQLAARRGEQLKEQIRSRRAGPAPYEPSAGLTAAFEDFLAQDQELFVVSGGSGRGKTTWASRLLGDPPSGYEVLVVAGEEIGSDDENLVDTLARQLAKRPDSAVTREATQRAAWSWLDRGNRLLIIDGLDRVIGASRKALYAWLDTTAALAEARAMRLILTSRPEAWIGLRGQVSPATLATIYTPLVGSGVASESHTSHRLALLDPEEAGVLYAAYGLPRQLHGRRPLRTPALIRICADLTGALRSSDITRTEIFSALLKKITAEVSRHDVGSASAGEFLDRVGELLTSSSDGTLERDAVISACADGARLLDVFLQTDLLALHDRTVQAEPDEAAEYLGSRVLDVKAALTDLRRRAGERLFAGMFGMAVAHLASQDPTRAGEIINAVFSDQSLTEETAQAAITILAEVPTPAHFEPHVTKLYETILGGRVFLSTGTLQELMDAVRLAPGRNLELLLDFCDTQDPDDWRPKYWVDPDATGRWVTPFAKLAAAAIRTAPAESVRVLRAQYDVSTALPSILQGLLMEASLVAPDEALAAARSLKGGLHRDVYTNLTYLHPAAAARQILEGTAGGPAEDAAVGVLWGLARNHSPLANPEPPPREVIARVASVLLPRTTAPADRARLLLAIAEARPLDQEEQATLAAEWDAVDRYDVWPLITACTAHQPRLLDRLFSEAGAGGAHDSSLTCIISRPPWNLLIERLHQAAATAAGEVQVMVADAVEMMLYEHEVRDQPDERLREMARSLARSAAAAVRAKILYFAGSPVRFSDTTTDNVAFRDELLTILISHEDGRLLSTLVWKICESATERGRAAERLVYLSRLFGVAAVEPHLELGFIGEVGEALQAEFELGLRAAGLARPPAGA
jgi:hypothetical protein